MHAGIHFGAWGQKHGGKKSFSTKKTGTGTGSFGRGQLLGHTISGTRVQGCTFGGITCCPKNGGGGGCLVTFITRRIKSAVLLLNAAKPGPGPRPGPARPVFFTGQSRRHCFRLRVALRHTKPGRGWRWRVQKRACLPLLACACLRLPALNRRVRVSESQCRSGAVLECSTCRSTTVSVCASLCFVPWTGARARSRAHCLPDCLQLCVWVGASCKQGLASLLRTSLESGRANQVAHKFVSSRARARARASSSSDQLVRSSMESLAILLVLLLPPLES